MQSQKHKLSSRVPLTLCMQIVLFLTSACAHQLTKMQHTQEINAAANCLRRYASIDSLEWRRRYGAHLTSVCQSALVLVKCGYASLRPIQIAVRFTPIPLDQSSSTLAWISHFERTDLRNCLNLEYVISLTSGLDLAPHTIRFGSQCANIVCVRFYCTRLIVPNSDFHAIARNYFRRSLACTFSDGFCALSDSVPRRK